MRPLIFLTGIYPHQRTIQLFGRVVCLIVATALLFSSVVRGEDVPPPGQTAMSFYSMMLYRPNAEQVEALYGRMKAECSMADPVLYRFRDRTFHVVTIASMPPEFIASAFRDKTETNPKKPSEVTSRLLPVLKSFYLLHSYVRCVVASIPADGDARANCLFSAASLAELLRKEAAHARNRPKSLPDEAADVLANALKVIENSGALEQFDEVLLRGVASVQLDGATFRDQMVQWRAAVGASPNDAFRLLGLELKLLQIATPENVLSRQLPEVFQLDSKTYLRTIVRDYISRDFLPEPKWLDQDTVVYDKSVADEMALRVAGIYLIPPIIVGKDATYRRLWYVFGICQINEHGLYTMMSRRLAMDLWEPLARFETVSFEKFWNSSAPKRGLKKIKEGMIEDVTFLGEYTLSGKGHAKIDADHVFPVVLFCQGKAPLPHQDYGFFGDPRAQADALGSTGFLLHDRRLHGPPQYSWPGPPLPIGLEMDYDYTDEGLARMGMDQALVGRVTKAFCRTPKAGFKAEELREKFDPAVFYLYHNCRYEIYTVLECSEFPGVVLDLPLAAVVIYPCEGEKPVSASPMLLCKGAETWNRKVTGLAEPYSWHIAELSERPEIKVISEEAGTVTDDIAIRFYDAWRAYSKRREAAFYAEFGEQADLGAEPKGAGAGEKKQ
ncbi:MAG: hypothetical protein WC712_09235 [Candidatus Brocadiia bacterium]